MLDSAARVLGLAVATIAIIGALVALVRWIRPRIHAVFSQVIAARDAIIGREAIRDSITGKEIEPALPGMGVRMAQQEQQSREQQAQMQLLTDAVAKIADSHTRLDGIESRVKILEDARIERVVTQAESAAHWRAVEAAHGDPDAGAGPAETPDLG